MTDMCLAYTLLCGAPSCGIFSENAYVFKS